MKASRYIFLSLLLLIVASPLAAQVNDTYVVAAAANAPGAFNTRWLTQLSIFNPQLDYPLVVSIVFMPTQGGVGKEVLVEIPPNAVALWDDVLGEVFKVAGTGALLVATFPEDNPKVPDDIISRSFLVTSNTFNDSRDGTFGQTIPGVWAGLQDYATDGISAVVHGIRDSARDGWRTNIGAVNLARRSVTMRVNVYDFDGRTILKNAPFTIPPLGHVQDRLPIEVDRGAIEFFVDDPSLTAVVFPYASTIDALSGDPTYQTPTLLASAKTIYGKRAISAAALTAPGKRIDTAIARSVREGAERLGVVIAPMR